MMEEESEGSGSRDEHTWRGDGRRQVVTSPLKGYEEYEAIQLLLLSGPPDDQDGHGSFTVRMSLYHNS